MGRRQPEKAENGVIPWENTLEMGRSAGKGQNWGKREGKQLEKWGKTAGKMVEMGRSVEKCWKEVKCQEKNAES